MSPIPRSYAVHLHLSGGQSETVMFATLEAFQQWYGGVLTAATHDTFVNVPIAELEGEYLVVRPSAVLAIRVEPRFNALDA
jgi:predicted DNA-binding protein with PD1-like motif